MQNYEVDVLFFCPWELSAVELVISNLKLTMSEEIFKFTYTYHSSKLLAERFHEKQYSVL